MVQFNYKREYTLTIEEPIEVVKSEDTQDGTEEQPIENKATKNINKDDLSSIEVDSVVLSQLQIKATVEQSEKTQGSNPTSNSIEIYNLSKQTRDKIAKKNSLVVLSAGYEGNTRQVFTGQVSRPNIYRQGTDVITKLYCEDGYSPIRSVRYSKSFPKDTLYSDIFEDIISQFVSNGVARASEGIILTRASKTPNKNNIPSELRTERSWSHSGFLFEGLDKLCKQFDYKWQIIFNRLYVYPRDDSEMSGTVTLDQDGIVSIRENEESTEKVSSDDTPAGIKVKTLLNGDVNTAKLLILENTSGDVNFNEYAGTYRVVSVRHDLDYEGQSWYTTIECEGISE